MNVEILDRHSLRRRVGGDLGLLREMVAIFAAEYPQMLDHLEQAIEHGESSAVEKVSHKLKGSLVQFSAREAAQAAARLESLGKLHALDEAGAVFQDLKSELEKVMQALNAVVSGGFTE